MGIHIVGTGKIVTMTAMAMGKVTAMGTVTDTAATAAIASHGYKVTHSE
jgi:hypothetical protein